MQFTLYGNLIHFVFSLLIHDSWCITWWRFQRNEWWQLMTDLAKLRLFAYVNECLEFRYSYSDKLQWYMVCFHPKADPPVYFYDFQKCKILIGCIGLIIVIMLYSNQWWSGYRTVIDYLSHTCNNYSLIQIPEKFFAMIHCNISTYVRYRLSVFYNTREVWSAFHFGQTNEGRNPIIRFEFK